MRHFRFIAAIAAIGLTLLPLTAFAAAQELIDTPLYGDANLKYYWQLEDATATVGSANFSTNGTVVYDTGMFNNGADFGSSNGHGNSLEQDGLAIDLSGDWSMSFWFKLNTAMPSGQGYDFIQWNSSDGTAAAFVAQYRNDSGTPYFRINNDSNTQDYDVTFTPGTWYNIAFVAASGSVQAYINDVNVSSLSFAGGSTGNTFKIGGDQYGGVACELDDMAIFDRQLTSDELEGIYSGFSGPTPTPTSTATSTGGILLATAASSTGALLQSAEPVLWGYIGFVFAAVALIIFFLAFKDAFIWFFRKVIGKL